ncbi:MAG: transporter substrate-binding protein, partial [Caldilineaceae bacterium]|nr:transporter substrate-binding protein [Caldilineaceae bacterium]
ADPIEAGYFGVYVWKALVEAAGSFDVDAVRAAAKENDIEIAAPGGPIKVDGETQHMYKTVRIGQITDDGLITEVWASDGPVKPNPWLKGIDWAEGLAEGASQ